jgi:hypothetical protein
MNTEKIMDVIKKNLLIILCAVVAIAALIAAYWPVGNFFAELQTQTQQRAAMYGTLNGLLTKPRNLPLTDPSKTTQDPLPYFPTEAIIAEGKKATDEVSEESKKMVQNVINLNQASHPLLVSDAVPAPVSDTPKFRFRDLYKLVLSTDPAVSIKTNPDLQAAKQPNLYNDMLQAAMPPLETDITAKEADAWTNQYQQRIIYSNGQPVNKDEVDAAYAKAKALIPDQMKSDVATQHKIYASPDVLVLEPNVVGPGVPDVYNIWMAQMRLWIQQDVCSAIAQANAKATNVLDSPVKRLIKLGIPQGTYVLPSGTAAGGAAVAAAVAVPVEGGDIAVLPKNTNVSPTGRVCNAMYDVVSFSLVIDVQASQIPYVLATLSQNRLIDVYNMDIISVDNAEQHNAGFLYGTEPVVRLSLKCEGLFMRSWTAPYMPTAVKAMLGIAPPPAVGPSASAQ